MVTPAIKLHRMYSLNFYEDLDIIFEDLSMINMAVLKDAIKTKNYNIEIVPKTLWINMKDGNITLFGHRINKKTFMINKERNGDIHMITYSCPEKNIIQGLEFLYQICMNNGL